MDKFNVVTPIGINFGDNDFGNTFRPFMKFLHSLEFTPTKEQVVKLFNEMGYGFYLARQNLWQYDNGEDHTKEYLQIDESNVLMGSEVDLWIMGNNYNHSCWVIYHNTHECSYPSVTTF